MGLLEDSLRGVAVGVGAAVGLGLVAPMVGGRGRPLTKGLVRGYLNLRDRIYEAGAETKEQISDLMAEVRAERAGTRPGGHTAAAPAENGRRTRKAGRRKTAAAGKKSS